MAEYVVKIIDAGFVTHDVKRFTIERPDGYTFIPGQGTDVSINLPNWRDKLRPFTFTNIPKADYLEFMIKIYMDHKDGVTQMLSRINAGGELILHDVFGAIQYKGPGVFIAGGAGVTPFISIFRELQRTKQLPGNKLICSNKGPTDVILNDEFQKMLKDNFINIYTRQNNIGFLGRRIDRDFLVEHVSNFGQYFYVCGPDKFVSDIKALLFDLGAEPESLVIEK